MNLSPRKSGLPSAKHRKVLSYERHNLLKIIALTGLGLWVFYSAYLLISSGSSSALLYFYLIYLSFGIITVFLCRDDILAPPSIFTLIGFLSFGSSIPLISAGELPQFQIADSTLVKVLTVFLAANVAFIVGYLLPLYKAVPTRWVVGKKRFARRVSVTSFLILVAALVGAGAIRLHFHLGEAGVQPSVAYAGYLQYLLFNGVLLMCLWFLAQGLVQGRIYLLLGLSLLLGVALTQALLGWRGAIFHMLILAFIIFWYQKKLHHRQKIHSFGWLILIVIMTGSLVQLGNAVRSQTAGGEKGYAATKEEFVEKIATRAQGTTRLAAVVEYFGPISFTNNFLITDLFAKEMSTTAYIDQKVYGVEPHQSHSVGTSGPGGPYTAMGVLGVLISYGLLGGFYRSAYGNLFFKKKASGNIVAIVFYAVLISSLFGILAENFGLSIIKLFAAIIGLTIVARYLVTKK